MSFKSQHATQFIQDVSSFVKIHSLTLSWVKHELSIRLHRKHTYIHTYTHVHIVLHTLPHYSPCRNC
jgi:hypothetical protein